ncbi:Serine aminopeptidase, S33 [Desulfatibacillum alkenivorans DSM 16219]|jgi:dienelactone hydrolase|uniref:Serine aminopeptidase, S33 n=1 Tax=Desulfatibacillum alkenivorans DSM 16219 TaxID=1121393 RepID=A0A1M6ZSB8_9BACT|nr:alpha/beta fold hydrolase [Desulfatibacillum alkenivorans]SHL33334.1 Serine aminopeptidase, S33 [Desulfatibacillum alkenivorans DSM 16219]
MKYKTEQSNFRSQNVTCDGEFLLPQGVENPPVVVMAHGFCAEKAFRLYDFAQVFLERGIAAFLFDYRGFGKSDGFPRHHASPKKHVQDWHAALEHVRKSGLVNPHKIALWGSSFSGGHVLKVAAKDRAVRAVVSQVPFTDGFDTLSMLGPQFLAKATKAISKDLWSVVSFGDPIYIPAVGEVGRVAALNQPGNLEGYLAIIPEDSEWENKVTARSLLEAAKYRPGFAAAELPCPSLFVLATEDNLCPYDSAKRFAKASLYSEIMTLECGHFDLYLGDLFDKVSAAEADFLEKNLA